MEIQSDYQNPEIEVQIASGGVRVLAYLINVIAQFVVCIPIVVGLISGIVKAFESGAIKTLEGNELALVEQIAADINMTLVGIGVLVLLAYAIWQIIMMSTRGQSLGKQIMNIAVIKEDGSHAGFIGVVLLREVVFILGAMILATLATFLVGQGAIFDLVYYGAFFVCLVMIFTAKDRRTLQDMIAGTVVVKLPPKSSR